MAQEGRTVAHFSGNEYRLAVWPEDGLIHSPAVICNGVALVNGKDFRLVRSEPWRKHSDYQVEFIRHVADGDMLQFTLVEIALDD